MTFDERLHQVEDRLVRVEMILLTALVLGMTVLGFLQIVLRKAFSGGFLWADVFLRHLVLWVAFLGAGVAAATEKHFGADLGDRLFKGRAKVITRLLVHVFTLGACAFLSKAALDFITDEFEVAPVLFRIGALSVPGSLFEIILPLGFLLLLVHFALKALMAALEIRK